MSHQGWAGMIAAGMVFAGVTGSLYREHRDLGGASVASVADARVLVASIEGTPAMGETELFTRLLELVKREYVDPVTDEQALAIGAVKGMVDSLNDPTAEFMEPAQFKAFQSAEAGRFEGVGVELTLRYDPKATQAWRDYRKALSARAAKPEDERGDLPEFDAMSIIPDLVVTGVAPGSPASLAGLQVGAVINGVNGRVLLNQRSVAEFRDLNRRLISGRLSEAEAEAARKRQQAMIKNTVNAAKVRNLLTTGAAGTVKVAWSVGEARAEKTITRRVTQLPRSASASGTIPIRFTADNAVSIQTTLRSARRVDLRNSGLGDAKTLRAVLKSVAPTGDLGVLISGSNRMRQPLGKGTAQGVRWTFVVDSTTRGAAEVFALALQRAGLARLEGGRTFGERTLYTARPLPDGSGYVLPTARWEAAK